MTSVIHNTFHENIEQIYVKDVYEQIAEEFDKSRWRIWNKVGDFLSEIPEDNNINVVEVGCGNGRNLGYLYEKNNKVNITAVDNCENFCKIIRERYSTFNTLLGDNLNLSLLDESFDYVLSIAVIHHFATEDRRRQAVGELLRITKPGGKIIITVWADKPPENNRFVLTAGDQFINWKNQYQRYYHVFSENELEELIPEGYHIKSFYDRGNYGVIITKC